MRDIEDGFGCAGLVPTRAEKEQEELESRLSYAVELLRGIAEHFHCNSGAECMVQNSKLDPIGEEYEYISAMLWGCREGHRCAASEARKYFERYPCAKEQE